MKRKWMALLALVGLCVLTACTQQAAPPQTSSTDSSAAMAQEMDDAAPVKVVTTIYPLYDLAQKIGGERVSVTLLVPETVDVHDYAPSARDIATIAEADLFIYSSHAMESWVSQIEQALPDQAATFVEASEGLALLEGGAHHHHEHDGEEGHSHDSESGSDHHDHGGVDPHVWVDPVNAQQLAHNIAAALSEHDAAHQEAYQAAATEVVEQLTKLDAAYRSAFEQATQRVFVTQHAAFGYLAARYQLEQVFVSGLTAPEPTAQDIAAVQEEIKAHQLTVIFVDPTSPKDAAETIARETGVSVETLYTMEQPVAGMDYLSMLQANLTALKKEIH